MLNMLMRLSMFLGFCYCVDVSAALAKNRILVLHPYDETLPASVRAGEAVRTHLTKQYGDNIEIYSEYLELSRFTGEQYQRFVANHLAEKYASKPLSLTIALGAAALNFALDHRAAFGTATPIVYCCVKSSMVANLDTSSNVFGVLSDYDVRETVDLALRLQSDARQLVVVSGASEVDQLYEAEARRTLETYNARLTIRYLSGLPRDELVSAVSAVPRDSIILMLTYLTDNTGRQLMPREIARSVAEAASAPTYAVFDTMMGTGIVGGHMDTFEGAATAATELAVQVLAGNVPASERIVRRTAHNFFVDARQLERWNLPRSKLPSNTAIQFEKPSLWDTHRNEVVATAAAFSIAMLALAILLAQVRRRVKAESHLRESEERLNFAAASGGIGLWQYDTREGKLWTSEHCRAIFGLSSDCPLTTDLLLRRVHPEDRNIAASSVRAATYGPHAETLLEFRIVHPDGRVRSIQGRGHSMLDGDGNTVRVSGIFRDLTAYRTVQKEAKELSQRLLSIQDEERQRIGQELHDSTAQHLAAINLNLMALRSTCHSIEQGAPLFADIQSSLMAAMNELRTFTYLLYPQELGHGGLQGALVRYIDGFRQRTGLNVTLRATEELDDLAQCLQHSLLRIVQESLANVHRHASASRVTVKIQRRGNRMHLLIADNGIGLRRSPSVDRKENPVLPAGVGIPGMTARARQLGGRLDVRSRTTGTLVHASLPVELARHGPTLGKTSTGILDVADRSSGEPVSLTARRKARIGPSLIRRSEPAQERQHPL